MKKKIYEVIEVPPSGKHGWIEGARSMFFVYSRNNGNFILRGFRGDVEKYLKQHYTHYFYYVSMWYNGRPRGYWKFWKDSIYILSPSITQKKRKYTIASPNSEIKDINLKRLPRRWIPEFNKF